MRNDKGFSIITALVMIVALTLIVIAGYFVWGQQNDEHSSKNESTATQELADPNTTNLDDETPDYLVIEEWDIKIELTPILAEASYGYEESGAGNYIALNVGISEDSNNACIMQAIIERIEYSEYLKHQSDGGFLQDYKDGKHIGNYYYYLLPSQSSCIDENTPLERTILKKSQVIRSEWIKQSTTITQKAE